MTTATPGCREICRPGKNGLLVPPRDPAALAAAIVRLLGDPDLRRAMGERGREVVRCEFSLDRVVDETLLVYQALERVGGASPGTEAVGAAAVALSAFDSPPA